MSTHLEPILRVVEKITLVRLQALFRKRSRSGNSPSHNGFPHAFFGGIFLSSRPLKIQDEGLQITKNPPMAETAVLPNAERN
jgi:hypothetical protein